MSENELILNAWKSVPVSTKMKEPKIKAGERAHTVQKKKPSRQHYPSPCLYMDIHFWLPATRFDITTEYDIIPPFSF